MCLDSTVAFETCRFYDCFVFFVIGFKVGYRGNCNAFKQGYVLLRKMVKAGVETGPGLGSVAGGE